MVATVDVISNGRVELGLGSGVQKAEHQALGFNFCGLKNRVDQLREAVEVIVGLWSKEQTSFNGKYYRIEDAFCVPKPIQKPYVPITIGGASKYTLEVTAQFANRCDFGFLGCFDAYKERLALLAELCEVYGRRFVELEKACWPFGQISLVADDSLVEGTVNRLKPANVSLEDFEKVCFVGTAQDLVEKLRAYVDLGVSHFMLNFEGLPDLSGLKVFANQVACKLV